MKLTRKSFILLLVLFCLALAYFARGLYLPALAKFLICSDPLEHADAIVVLAGDDVSGDRVKEAVSLVRQGWSDQLIFTDAPIAWHVNSWDVMSGQARELGIPSDKIVEVRGDSPAGRGQLLDSTLSESRLVLAACKARGFKTLIIVTSNYHTRRARRIYNDLFKGSGIRVLIHPSLDDEYRVDRWWTRRADARTWLLEIEKTAFSYLEFP